MGLGPKLIHLVSIGDIKDYFDENVLPTLDNVEEDLNEYSTRDYSFENTWGIIDIKARAGIEYIEFTETGRQVYFKLLDME